MIPAIGGIEREIMAGGSGFLLKRLPSRAEDLRFEPPAAASRPTGRSVACRAATQRSAGVLRAGARGVTTVRCVARKMDGAKMRSTWIPVLFVLVTVGTGCHSTITVGPTAADSEHLAQVEALIPAEDFFVPAEVRFVGPLLAGAPVTTNPTLAFTGRGNKYVYPAFDVVRDACAIAVRRSFKGITTPPKAFLRDDALEVEFTLRKFLLEHEGGEGEARCTLEIGCEVRYPAPSTYVVASFSVVVDQIGGAIAEDGTGAGGPGVLWLAAGEMAKRAADLLRSPAVRSRFARMDDFIAWRSNVDGHAPPEQQRPQFDLKNTWGEYQPVVVLR
jgi:hypothetical protein